MRRISLTAAVLFCVVGLVTTLLLSVEVTGAQGPAEPTAVPPVQGTAASAAPSYSGIDAVFIVDQSGSMCGSACGSTAHPTANDTQGWRFLALKSAIVDRIGEWLWQTHPGSTARVGIVEFGTQAEAALDPYTIDAKSQADWTPIQNELVKFLDGYQAKRENAMLGNTNDLAAFQVARDMFNDMERDDSSSRVKALFLITDGRPCLSPTEQLKCPGWEEQLQRLRDDYLPKNFPANQGYRIYVIGINDSDDNYWEATRSYWEQIANSHGGFAERASTESQMAADINSSLAGLMALLPALPGAGPAVPVEPEVLKGDSYSVQPYLQSLEIQFYKSAVTDTLKISEIGTPLDLEQAVPSSRVQISGQDKLLEIVRIQNPKPGVWSIVRPQGRTVIVLIQGIRFNANLIRPLNTILRGIPQQVDLKLTDSSADPAPKYDDPLYRLTVQASIKSDSGTEERISLSEAQPGVFSGVYLAQSDAKRVLHLTGTSNEPSGKTITIFDFNAATWSVKPVTFTIDALPSQLCQSSPNNVGVRFVDDERNPITEIPDSRYALSAALTFRSSGVTETVPLARMDNGIYRGQWTPASAGLYSADLSASSVDAQGSHFTNFDVADAIRAASVKASTALSAASTTGKLEEQQPIYFWFPIYSPLQLDFELRNEKAQLFDAAAAGISPTDLVGVKVTDPNGKAVDPKDIKLRPANQKGELHLEGNGLDTRGKWLIDITPNTLSLGEGCSVAASTSHFVVERDDNWLPYVVDGLVVLALGALFAQRTARFIGDHHGYMLSGSIYIQDGIGTNLPNGTKALRSLKVNRVVYTSRDLPAAAGIKKLTVKRVQLPKREAVDIEAEMSRGGSQIFKDRSYGSRCDLGNKYYIKYMQY